MYRLWSFFYCKLTIYNICKIQKGIPLGNYTSQFFGNFYLNQFDHWLKEEKKVRYYFRYCDDIVILGNNKSDLYQLRKDIQEYLDIHLKLELSNYQVFPVESRGIDFLGYKNCKLSWMVSPRK